MKYGIISDIHGNIVALNEVLNRLQKERVDQIICLGDIIGIGPHPNECVEKLMEYNNIIIVKGNHEGYFIDGVPEYVHDDKRSLSLEEIQHHEWIAQNLQEKVAHFLKDLTSEKIISASKKKISIVHYPSMENGTYQKNYFHPSEKELLDIFKFIEADVYLFGHTHQNMVNHCQEKWYINPGALGCPKYQNYAPFGILQVEEENIHYTQMAVEYDVDAVMKDIESLHYPDSDMILKIFFGK